MSLGDLQACPWCAFVGTPALFDLHMAHHEQTWIADREELAKAQEEIRRLKVQLKERQKDYSKTIKEIIAMLPKDSAILHEIAAERLRQDEKWGEQNHPDGTQKKWAVIADGMRAKCQSKAEKGELTWRDILEEEIWEAYGETDEDKLRAELVQSAAVLVNWIGAIDRRKKNDEENVEVVDPR